MKARKEPPIRPVNGIWILGGGYLIYTAAQLLYNFFTGTTEIPVGNVLGGVVFALAGALMLFREWQVYRANKARRERQASEMEEPREEETP